MIQRIIVENVTNAGEILVERSGVSSLVFVEKSEESYLEVTPDNSNQVQVIIAESESEHNTSVVLTGMSDQAQVQVIVEGQSDNPTNITVMTGAVQVTSVSLEDIQDMLDLYELDLNAPTENLQVLASTTDKTRSWVSHNSIHGKDGGKTGEYYHLTKAEYDALKNGYYRCDEVTITGGINNQVLFNTPFADGTIWKLASVRFVSLDRTTVLWGEDSAPTVNGFYWYADDSGYLTYDAKIVK